MFYISVVVLTALVAVTAAQDPSDPNYISKPPSFIHLPFREGVYLTFLFSARCPFFQFFTWYNKTWTTGGIRDYYVSRGPKRSFDECVQDCARQDDCYFASMTHTKNCYFLTTTTSTACRTTDVNGHFGPIREPCAPLKPCPSAYKQCVQPRCSLLSMLKIFCDTRDKQQAFDKCTL